VRAAARKIAGCLVTVFLVLTINFFIFRMMPGDPVKMLMRNPKIPREAIEKFRRELGLDRPLHVQFGRYLASMVRGDLGESFTFKRPVVEVLWSFTPATLLLVGSAEVIALALGLAFGVLAASRRGRTLDAALTGTSLVLYSMPTFLPAVVLLVLLSAHLGLFPSGGFTTPGEPWAGWGRQALDVLAHLALPLSALVLSLYGSYQLLVRETMVDVLSQDFVVAARAKALPGRRVLLAHALPNALLPVVAMAALNFGYILSGAVQVEIVFSWPGLGRLMYDAITARDFPVLQGLFLALSLCVVTANLLADLVCLWLDPRIREV
jgi:peptide/nickel transport system permease protein